MEQYKSLFEMSIIIIVIVVVVLFLKRFLDSLSNNNVASTPVYNLDGVYKKKSYFFSISEKKMYYILKDLLLSEYHGKYTVFPKVGLLDFVEVNKYIKDYKVFYNKMAQKHIDFLIVNQDHYCDPVLAIELNGASHRSEKVVQRDEFVGEIYNSIKLNFITFQNYDIDNKDYILTEIKKILS